jgi:hypothetical protein
MIGVEILKASAFLRDTVQIGIDRCQRGRQHGYGSDCEIVDVSL